MRYNENDGEEVNGKVIITSDIDDNPIFEISCVLAGDINVDTISANFDLVVIGDVDAEKISVSGDFTCLGNLHCDEIAIQGACTVDGDLEVGSGFIGDSLFAKDICAEAIEVKGSISCTNLECNDNVVCEGCVLISEGVTGSGSLESKMSICGEYSLLEATSGVFVADELEMQKPKMESVSTPPNSFDLEGWRKKARELKPQTFFVELTDLSKQNEKYKSEWNAFHKLMLVENIKEVPTIKIYVDIMDVVNKKYDIISNSPLFEKIRERYLAFSFDDISYSKMQHISQRDFAKMMYILSFKPQLFEDDVRDLILETLYAYIDLDYFDVIDKFFTEKKLDEKDREAKKRDLGPSIEDKVLVTKGVWKDTEGVVNSVDTVEKSSKGYDMPPHDVFITKKSNTVKVDQLIRSEEISIGDKVSIIKGVWTGYDGVVHAVNTKKRSICVLVKFRGRETKVDVSNGNYKVID